VQISLDGESVAKMIVTIHGVASHSTALLNLHHHHHLNHQEIKPELLKHALVLDV
jgi:hypothetical protein